MNTLIISSFVLSNQSLKCAHSKYTFYVDQTIGCFCYCSAQKQTESLPIEKVHALCIGNQALFIVKLWNINILNRFLSLILTQFVPSKASIYVVLKYTFQSVENKDILLFLCLLWKVDFFNRKWFGLFLYGAITETADHFVYLLW